MAYDCGKKNDRQLARNDTKVVQNWVPKAHVPDNTVAIEDLTHQNNKDKQITLPVHQQTSQLVQQHVVQLAQQQTINLDVLPTQVRVGNILWSLVQYKGSKNKQIDLSGLGTIYISYNR